MALQKQVDDVMDTSYILYMVKTWLHSGQNLQRMQLKCSQWVDIELDRGKKQQIQPVVTEGGQRVTV